MTAQTSNAVADGHADGQTQPGAGTGEANPAEATTAPKTGVQHADPFRLACRPCDRCGEPITSNGRAIVDLAAASRRSARYRRWVNDGAQGQRPALVKFRLLCQGCASSRNKEATFSVRVRKLGTDRRLLRQTLTVVSKPWFHQVDWIGLVGRILSER